MESSGDTAAAHGGHRDRTGRRAVKRALKDAMGELDELAGDDGALNSAAYARLAKALKGVHDATEKQERENHVRAAKLYALESPHTLTYAPEGVEPYGTEFVNDLVRLKKQQLDRKLRDVADAEKREALRATNVVAFNEWVVELAEHYVGPPCADYPTSDRVNGIFFLAECDGELFGEPMRKYVEGEIMDVWCVCRCDDEDTCALEVATDEAPQLTEWFQKCVSGKCPHAGTRCPCDSDDECADDGPQAEEVEGAVAE